MSATPRASLAPSSKRARYPISTTLAIGLGFCIGAFFLPRLDSSSAPRTELLSALTLLSQLAFALQSSELVRVGRFAWAAVTTLLASASVFTYGAYAPSTLYAAGGLSLVTCIVCAMRQRGLAYGLVWLGAAFATIAKWLALQG